MKNTIVFIVLLTCIMVSAYGQDPAYQDFIHSRFLFNPSLTGSYGSQSWKVRSKFQWNRDGGGGYKTASLLFEETMPCSILDIGAKVNYNEEGAGIYRTLEAGFLTSAFLPFSFSQFSDHNFRMGIDFSWGINSIDFSRLVWSDQLHPKYGIIFPSSFIPPNEGRSSWYFNPGFGVSLRSIWNKKKTNAVMTNFGLALYRFYSIEDGEINQSVSILGLKSTNPYRISFFAESEFVPLYYGGKYVSVRPHILAQKQGPLYYLEAGMRLGYTRTAGVGACIHTVPGNTIGQTPWLSVTTDFMIPIQNGKRLELNFTYSENLGGLKNLVGPQFEIGISYHFAKSGVCNLLGMEDDVPYNTEYVCPIMALTPGKRKMYENIWYKK